MGKILMIGVAVGMFLWACQAVYASFFAHGSDVWLYRVLALILVVGAGWFIAIERKS